MVNKYKSPTLKNNANISAMTCDETPDNGAAAGVYNRTWDNLNIYRTNMTYHCPVGQGRISSILIGPAHTILRSHWSRASQSCLRQQSYAIKKQLGHRKPPTRGFRRIVAFQLAWKPSMQGMVLL